MRDYELTLNLVTNDKPDEKIFKQYDTGNEIKLEVLENENLREDKKLVLSNQTVLAFFKRADGQVLQKNCSINKDGNIIVKTSKDVLGVPGTLELECLIKDGDIETTTTRMSFDVKESIARDKSITEDERYKSDLVTELLDVRDNVKKETIEQITETNKKVTEVKDKVGSIISANYVGARSIEEVADFNSTTYIQNAINSAVKGSVITLLPGTYLVGQLTVKDNISIDAPNVTLKLLDSINNGSIFKISKNSNVYINGLTLDGGNSTIPALDAELGTRNGISIENDSQCVKLSNLHITGFSGNGIYNTVTGYSRVHAKSTKIINTDVEYCYHGINIAYRGEYTQLANISISKCRIGLRVVGSNTQGINLHINDNQDGAHFLFEENSNNSHSLFSNCSFNHNLNYPILAKDFSVGISFVGCHCHAHSGTPGIRLENCSGFTWSAGEIRVTPITVVGGGYNRFDNNIFDKTAITQSGGYTEFRDNYTPTGVSDSTRSNMPTYYVARKLSANFKIKNTDENIINFNSGNSYLYGSTSTTAYNTSTGIGTITTRGVYNVNITLDILNAVAADNQATITFVKSYIKNNATVDVIISKQTVDFKANENRYFNMSFVDIFNNDDTYKVIIQATKYITLQSGLSKLTIIKS